MSISYHCDVGFISLKACPGVIVDAARMPAYFARSASFDASSPFWFWRFAYMALFAQKTGT